MPLPTTRLFHPSFEAHHRPVADGQATGTCRVDRPSSGTVWDDTTGTETPAPPTVVYDGPCRYQYQSAAGQPTVADTPVPLADVRVVVPADGTEYRVNDVVTVLAAPTNPDLVGRRLNVQAVSGSSVSWQRDLYCQLRQPTSR